MPLDAQTTDTRLKVAETRIDNLEQRVTTHGEEIDAASEQLHELEVRAHYRDESMGELKAMSRQTADALDSLRQDFAEERMANKSRFDSRDAATYAQVKGYVICAVITAIATLVLTQIGLK